MMVLAFQQKNFPASNAHLTMYGDNYNNIKQMGLLLYTKYLYPFEIAAVVLVVAIVSAITLAFHGRKPGTKSQNIDHQHRVKAADRVRIVKMKTEERQ